MGVYYFSVPENLALFFNEKHNAKYFVETGTFLGETALLASKSYKKVFTIEIAEELFLNAKQKYKNISNIQFMMGNSTTLLPEIIQQVNSMLIDSEKILFWLDAHYCGGPTGGENISCPLLEEINLILNLNKDAIILIDDARYILYPDPKNNVISDMPSYEKVLSVINSHVREAGNRYTFIWRDVLVSVPVVMAESVYSFLQPKRGIEGILFFDEYIRTMSLGDFIRMFWKARNISFRKLVGKLLRFLGLRK